MKSWVTNSTKTGTGFLSRHKLFWYSLTVLLVALLVIFYISGGNRLNRVSQSIQSVSYVSSSDDINFDVAAGMGDDIHLVWMSAEQGLQYQRSEDRGTTWTEPITVTETVTYLVSKDRPRIFRHEDTLSIFWWWDGSINVKTSFDDGRTWPVDTTKHFDFFSPDRTTLHAIENLVYLAYQSQKGLFFSRSENLGLTWTEPIRVRSGNLSYREAPEEPSIAVWNNDVYLLWSEHERLWWTHSEDRGDSWGKTQEINTDRRQFGAMYDDKDNIYRPYIIASRGEVSIFYKERGLFYQRLQKEVEAWSSPVLLAPGGIFQLSACAKSNKINIAWSDTRYRKQSWWGHIPGSQFFADPYWRNNDLHFASLSVDEIGKTVRLTPHLSYVSPRIKPVVSCLDEDSVIFWSGREKVRKTIDKYGFPDEIFFVFLSQ